MRRLSTLAVAFSGSIFAPNAIQAEGLGELSARDHFEHGVEASRKGDLPAALEHFEKAYARSPNQVVLYNLGQTYSGLGRSADAARALRRYLEADEPSANATRRAEVEELLVFNERRLGELDLSVEPLDARVEIDGAPAERDASGRVALVAGRHVVVVERSGYRTALLRIDVRAGAATQARLVLEREGAAAAGGAFVDLHCPVPNVSVWVDDVFVGKTPLAKLVSVAPGPHRIRFARPGYRGRDERLSASTAAPARSSCKLEVDPALSPLELGRLRVVTSEEQARVFVDARPAGGPLPAGPHDVEVRAVGFQTWRRSIELVGGEQKELIVELVPTAERSKARNARTRRTVAYATGSAGILLGGLSVVLYAVNQGRYDDWRRDDRALSTELASGRGSSAYSLRVAELHDRAASIQRMDDLALGSAALGGSLLAVSASLLLFGD